MCLGARIPDSFRLAQRNLNDAFFGGQPEVFICENYTAAMYPWVPGGDLGFGNHHFSNSSDLHADGRAIFSGL